MDLNTTSGLKGIDVTITGSPPIAKDNQDQTAVSLKLHTQKEIQKWRGTSQPDKSKAIQDGQPVETIKGHVIIQDMLDQDIHMLPATIDPFLKEGLAISWLWHGNKKQIFQQENYNFGNAAGTQVGLEMC